MSKELSYAEADKYLKENFKDFPESKKIILRGLGYKGGEVAG